MEEVVEMEKAVDKLMLKLYTATNVTEKAKARIDLAVTIDLLMVDCAVKQIPIKPVHRVMYDSLIYYYMGK